MVGSLISMLLLNRRGVQTKPSPFSPLTNKEEAELQRAIKVCTTFPRRPSPSRPRNTRWAWGNGAADADDAVVPGPFFRPGAGLVGVVLGGPQRQQH